jgi:FG-GAP repeat protein
VPRRRLLVAVVGAVLVTGLLTVPRVMGGSSPPPDPQPRPLHAVRDVPGSVVVDGQPWRPAQPWDFNGDGFEDLATPYGTVFDHYHPNGVVVLYGSAAGLGGDSRQVWTPDSPGVAFGHPTDFGLALGAGDFDGDGFTDLAASAPDDRAGIDRAVNLLYGSRRGLTADGNQHWTLDSPAVRGTARDGAVSRDGFAEAMGAGDFNADGFDDLAFTSTPNDGSSALNVLYGSGRGLTAAGNQRWSGERLGRLVGGVPRLSGPLVAGDFGRGMQQDLAVGVAGRGETSGAVVLYGTRRGLTARGVQLWEGQSPGVPPAEPWGGDCGDGTTPVLAAGDFGHSRHTDLALGSPMSGRGAGAVHVLYGSSSGITAKGSQLWTQDTPGVAGRARRGSYDGVRDRDIGPYAMGDGFGGALVAADFGHSGRADLAVYAPCDINDSAATLSVLYGSRVGLTAADHQYLRTVDGRPVPEPMRAGYFTSGGRAALVLGDLLRGGTASLRQLTGSREGLRPARARPWTITRLRLHPTLEGVED